MAKFVLRTMQVIRMSLIMLLICCGNKLAGLLMCMPDIGMLWIKPRVLGIKQQALACRDKIVGCCRQWGFKGEEFAVLSALTVGYKEELSDELRESYSVAGISHVLALSGLHVGILWFLLGICCGRFAVIGQCVS